MLDATRAAVLAAIFVPPALVHASPGPITLSEALARARQQSPQIVAARAVIGDAYGRLLGAEPLLAQNPVVAAQAGYRRWGAPAVQESVDWGVSLSQPMTAGGLWSRGPRVSAARAGLEAESWSARDTERRVLLEVAAAFLRAVHARQLVVLQEGAVAVTARLEEVAQRRAEAGDASQLDANLARAVRVEAEGRLAAARAAAALGLADLSALLDVPAGETVQPRGDLEELVGARPEEGGDDVPEADVAHLVGQGTDRPDLRALAAREREAAHIEEVGEAAQWPDVALGVSYANEERDTHIVLGSLSLTIPLFFRGQQEQAAGEARAAGYAAASAAAGREIERRIRAWFMAYQLRRDMLTAEGPELSEALDGGERLANAAYEAGEMPLVEWLAVRRELLAARVGHLDRLLETALARASLLSEAGVLR